MMTEESADSADQVAGETKKRLKVTVIGDSGVGKTCMLMTFVNKKFPDEDVPSLYENSTVKAGREGSFEVPVTLETGGVSTELGLTDTIGLDEYRRLREVFTVNTDLFLVCFSVTCPESLENVRQKWLTEIKILSPKAPFILVGTKTDLRDDADVLKVLKDKEEQPLSSQQGGKLSKTLGARAYVECSALKAEGVSDVFEIIPVALDLVAEESGKKSRKSDHSSCFIS